MKRKHWTLILAISLSLAVAFTAGLFHRSIVLADAGLEYPVQFWGHSVSDAVAASGISLYQGDQVQPPLTDSLKTGQVVSIARASWLVVGDGEKTHWLWASRHTPRQALNQLSLNLSTGDQLQTLNKTIDLDQLLDSDSSQAYQIVRASQIDLMVDGEQITLTSIAPTLGSALWEAGIQLSESDHLTPPAETRLNGQPVEARLERARPIVIQTKGQETRYRVVASTVGEALAAAGFALEGLDTSVPPEEAPLPVDGRIRIVHYDEEILLEQETQPFGLEYRPLDSIDLDTQQVVQTGEYGIVARRVRILYRDGEEISREIEDEWVAKQPQARVIGYGTRINLRSVDTPAGPVQYYRAVQVYATSYSPCRIGIAGQCSDRTASGATLQKGVIGVIRSWYNVMRGQRVYIPGYGFATIEDIGAGVSGQHWVDLGYSDDDWVGWARPATVYFLAPVPANLLYILD
jgi:uncharacterized protein YabE (DUF348 family)